MPSGRSLKHRTATCKRLPWARFYLLLVLPYAGMRNKHVLRQRLGRADPDVGKCDFASYFWASREKLTRQPERNWQGSWWLIGGDFVHEQARLLRLGLAGRAYKMQLLPHWFARWISAYWDWTVLDLCLYVCANVCLKHNRPWQGSMLPCDTAYSPDRCSLPHTTQSSLLNSLGICTNRIN